MTIANALVKRGHDITIKVLENGYDLLPLLDKRVKFEHVSSKRFPFWQNLKFFWTLFDDGKWEARATPKQLYKYYIAREKYDIEIAFFKGTPVKIISGSTNKKSKKIAWVHSDYLRCAGISTGFSNFKQVKKAYNKFNYIVCVSQQAKNNFVTKIGMIKNVICIYNLNPIDEITNLSNEKFKFKTTEFKIISVARLDRVKGYDRLLEACKRLNQEGYKYSLTIVGDGPDKDRIENYINENRLYNVYLAGMQLNPYKYIRNADLYVCSSYYEGYNLAVAESIIIGTPVLSTNCTGPVEILNNGEYGMIVENSIEGLYKGIKEFLTDKNLYNLYKEKTKSRINFFSPEKIITEVESLFE